MTKRNERVKGIWMEVRRQMKESKRNERVQKKVGAGGQG